MTEIALAMAMGFFSVMVLTAMSMGISVPQAKSQSQSIISAAIADSAPRAASGPVDKVTAKDVLVVFDGTRFFGRDLQPLDLKTIDTRKRVVLAVTPDLSMAQAIEARRRIPAAHLVITTLDGNWRRALKEKKNAS